MPVDAHLAVVKEGGETVEGEMVCISAASARVVHEDCTQQLCMDC